jgi:hypothetical protein
MLLTQVFEVITENQHNSIPEDKNVSKGEIKGIDGSEQLECKYIRQRYKGDVVMIVLKEEEWKLGE